VVGRVMLNSSDEVGEAAADHIIGWQRASDMHGGSGNCCKSCDQLYAYTREVAVAS